MTPETGNWSLLDPRDFGTELKELEDSGSPQLVVPLPRRFGGGQEEDEEATLEADEGFEIARSKEEAEEQRKVLEEVKAAPAKSPAAGLSSEAWGAGEDFELEQKRQETEIKRRNELMMKQSQELKDKEKQKAKAAKEFSDWLA